MWLQSLWMLTLCVEFGWVCRDGCCLGSIATGVQERISTFTFLSDVLYAPYTSEDPTAVVAINFDTVWLAASWASVRNMMVQFPNSFYSISFHLFFPRSKSEVELCQIFQHKLRSKLLPMINKFYKSKSDPFIIHNSLTVIIIGFWC